MDFSVTKLVDNSILLTIGDDIVIINKDDIPIFELISNNLETGNFMTDDIAYKNQILFLCSSQTEGTIIIKNKNTILSLSKEISKFNLNFL